MTMRLKVKPLMVFGALEAASLGLGVAFVLLGWPLVRRVAAPDRGRAWRCTSAPPGCSSTGGSTTASTWSAGWIRKG